MGRDRVYLADISSPRARRTRRRAAGYPSADHRRDYIRGVPRGHRPSLSVGSPPSQASGVSLVGPPVPRLRDTVTGASPGLSRSGVALLRLSGVPHERSGSGRRTRSARRYHDDARTCHSGRGAAREVLAERLRLPKTDVLDDGRQRLLRRLAALRSQHEWGHIDDAEYTKKTRETNTMLATMPSADRMVSFDQHRDVIETMAANIDAASGAQLTEAVARERRTTS